ncbi:MAG: hypothetical protein A2Y14_05745 [Verrucomicrobia bacterium GWF2_51_19]|nr:MAG: hypothetical protein A2Y14_05745 [Verrucomicrobia bacterium GWF2_51_19]
MYMEFLLGLFLGAGVIGISLIAARKERAKLDEEKDRILQEKRIVIDFMHDLVSEIGKGIDRKELFQKIARGAVLGTGAISACVYECTEDEQLRTCAIEGLFPPLRPLDTNNQLSRAKFLEKAQQIEVFEMGEGLVGLVAKEHKGLFIKDALNDPRVPHHKDPTLEIQSMILAPIVFQQDLLGVIAVVNTADETSFHETDFSLVRSLAEQAGMAIHNANLMTLQIEKNKMDFDLSLASNIQGMLLPQAFPSLPHLDISSFYKAAKKVGGDLYNAFLLSDQKLGVAIADVSGKGIPASLVMTMCQTHLEHFAYKHESPKAVLVDLNRAMKRELREDMFITLTYVIVDLSSNEITLARAGHELPLLFQGSTDGTIVDIPSSGMAIGMVDSDEFAKTVQESTFPFYPKDILLLYTDGITEAQNEAGEEFGKQRLKESLTLLKGYPSKEITQGIRENLDLFSGSQRMMDDMTLIVLKHV